MRFLSLGKHSPRRTKVRESIAAERAAKRRRFAAPHAVNSVLILLLFVALAVIVLAVEFNRNIRLVQVVATAAGVVLVTVAAAFYVHHYQGRIIRNHARAAALAILFAMLLAVARAGYALTAHTCWGTGTAAVAAIILSIAYDQRFAIGMSVFYCVLATFAVSAIADVRAFLVMTAAAYTCCLCLREVRTRIKLLEVGAIAAIVVFVTSLTIDLLEGDTPLVSALTNAGWHGFAALVVSVIIQGLLPLIEKAFRIATSMTLLDYSDANQPLLRRLAMEAPGTFSHSLMIGSIAEAAAEAIGRNGLLCRVGAYYHDIGKINKPSYFVENQAGPASRHEDLSPAMSQLIISGHVKDGKEIAKEYKLPAVLRQFIETHHGTTVIEYFYNEALKRTADNEPPPSESEYRYPGPKPRTKEAAIVMLADAIESAVRSLQEITPAKIEAVVNNVSMKRMQDGQLDECDMTFRELAKVQASMVKTLTAHYHGRIAYPEQPDQPPAEENEQKERRPAQSDQGRQRAD
jgi:putative nucleotidyltransferase with HDIG domain